MTTIPMTTMTTPTLGPNSTPAPASTSDRYLAPDWFTQHVFNRLVAGCTRIGLSLWGSRLLEVSGRSSGALRTTPVNVLIVDGERYLVAPRGVTQWVRNVRAARTAGLRLGRRVETVELVEVDDLDKPAILRPYLRRWSWEVGSFFDGVGADSTDEQLLAAAPDHPVFRLVSAH